jgi:hypothetical protein
MYIRQAKQFLRNVDSAFDERKFGFASLVDLLRACQREGLFRIERDRQGVIRLFPGNIMQPVDVDDDNRGNIAEEEPQPAADETAAPEWLPPVEAAGESEVVDGDVVQQMEQPSVVDGEASITVEETAAPARGRGRSARGRSRPAGEGRAARKPAEGAAPKARKVAAGKPRAPRKPRKESPAT